MKKTYNIADEYSIIVSEYLFHKELKKELIPLLENYPDEMGRRTVVKATMTNFFWGINRKGESDNKRLQRLLDCIVAEAYSHEDYIVPPWEGPRPSLFVKDCWANIYEKGDHTLPHHHQEYLMGFGFVYFLKTEWYHPPCVFTHSGKKIKAKEGTFVLFPNYLKHHVPKNRFKETRITLSGNILTVFKEGMIKQP